MSPSTHLKRGKTRLGKRIVHKTDEQSRSVSLEVATCAGRCCILVLKFSLSKFVLLAVNIMFACTIKKARRVRMSCY